MLAPKRPAPRATSSGLLAPLVSCMTGMRVDKAFLVGLAAVQVLVLSTWMIYSSMVPPCLDGVPAAAGTVAIPAATGGINTTPKIPTDQELKQILAGIQVGPEMEEQLAVARNYKAAHQFEESLRILLQVNAKYPNQGVVVGELAGVYYDLHEWRKSAKHFELAAKLSPAEKTQHLNNLGVANAMMKQEIQNIVDEAQKFKSQRKWDEAMVLLNKGFEKYNDSDTILAHMGGWYFDRENHEEAAKWYARAYAVNPGYAYHAINAANCLDKAHRTAESVRWMRVVFEAHPDSKQYLVNLFKLQMKANDWINFDNNMAKVLTDMRDAMKKNEKTLLDPFTALHLPLHPDEVQYIAHQLASDLRHGLNWKEINALPPVKKITPSGKMRIGYLSYDFRMHPVGLATLNIFENHDRDKYEVYAYDVFDRNGATDVIYETIKSHVDHMVALPPGMNPKDAIAKIREDQIDILVDLTLFTAGQRMNLFIGRSAPIQVGAVGLACTTGDAEYDYLLTDHVVVTPKTRPYYTESMMRMVHSYHPWAHSYFYSGHPQAGFKRSQLNPPLPDGKILYCNPANAMRQKPDVMKVWIEIVQAVPDAVLVMKYFSEDIAANLRGNIKDLGLRVTDDMNSQLMWLHGTGGKEHITWKSVCDVYLDTPYYNGHSTTADMLFAGVPMVTIAGETIAGRAAASFARSVGVPEMAVDNWADYKALAIELGTNHEKRLAWRKIINEDKSNNGLFDIKAYVRSIESGFEQARQLLVTTGSHQDIDCVDPLDKNPV